MEVSASSDTRPLRGPFFLREARDVAWGVHQVTHSSSAFARLDPRQFGRHSALLQPLHDRTQPVGRFRMAGAHIMRKIARIVNETGCSHESLATKKIGSWMTFRIP